MTWAVWVLLICAAVALVFVAYGAARAALAARVVKAHVDRVQSATVIADAAEAQVYAQRINDDLAQVEGLLARANAAIATINQGLHDLRIPEAIAALRTAGAAIRLLLSGR
ncbi:MAG TPA: hypothetical protein VFN49_07695 [Candidatus Aquilonibacter sp.]|nr:hypothetical protein [Candidatus Aquilonibacter sp.]